MRSLVNLADGAAGGSTPSSWERSSGPTSSRAGTSGGGSSRSGERGKRSNSGRKSGSSSSKKKEEPSGPMLHDGALESWGGLQVGVVLIGYTSVFCYRLCGVGWSPVSTHCWHAL